MVQRTRRRPDLLREDDPTMGFMKALHTWEEKLGRRAKIQRRMEKYAVMIVFVILILYFLLKYAFNVI